MSMGASLCVSACEWVAARMGGGGRGGKRERESEGLAATRRTYLGSLGEGCLHDLVFLRVFGGEVLQRSPQVIAEREGVLDLVHLELGRQGKGEGEGEGEGEGVGEGEGEGAREGGRAWESDLSSHGLGRPAHACERHSGLHGLVQLRVRGPQHAETEATHPKIFAHAPQNMHILYYVAVLVVVVVTAVRSGGGNYKI